MQVLAIGPLCLYGVAHKVFYCPVFKIVIYSGPEQLSKTSLLCWVREIRCAVAFLWKLYQPTKEHLHEAIRMLWQRGSLFKFQGNKNILINEHLFLFFRLWKVSMPNSEINFTPLSHVYRQKIITLSLNNHALFPTTLLLFHKCVFTQIM